MSLEFYMYTNIAFLVSNVGNNDNSNDKNFHSLDVWSLLSIMSVVYYIQIYLYILHNI